MPQDGEAYEQFLEAIIDFLKAKRDEAVKKGNTPTIDQLIYELEESRYGK